VIVYIESNFMLEIALEQEQSSTARSIFSLAESRQTSAALRKLWILYEVR